MKLDASIRKTISYAAKYGCVWSNEEIVQRLISKKAYKKEEILKYLVLMNYKKNDSSDNKKCIKKINLAKNLASKLTIFKNLLFLGITGSVATLYPKDDDDIDILVICKSNTLWLSRIQVKLYLLVHNISHRVYGDQEKPDRFCFNMWLEEDSLEIPRKKQNLRNGMDLILAIPLINRKNIYERFINKNDWAQKYVANGYKNLINKFIKKTENKIRSASFIDKLINLLMFKVQYLFMKKKISRELVGLKWAFFHPNG